MPREIITAGNQKVQMAVTTSAHPSNLAGVRPYTVVATRAKATVQTTMVDWNKMEPAKNGMNGSEATAFSWARVGPPASAD